MLVEPLQGSGGVIPGDRDFLHALRDATREHDVLLVLDEVMTSRLSTGGLQQVHGLTPDLTTFGKYIGGGLAFGAFGGRADLLSRFDPSRPDSLPHAGTFNNAVLTMAAGAAGLTEVYTAARGRTPQSSRRPASRSTERIRGRARARVRRDRLRLDGRAPLHPRPGTARRPTSRPRRSRARFSTSTCSRRATGMRAAASSRCRFRSAKGRSTASPLPSRASSPPSAREPRPERTARRPR